MRTLFLALLLGIGIMLAQAHAQGACDLDSGFTGTKDPGALAMFDRLKGTVAMGGNNVCSGALVTFKGRSRSARALVLTAAHCADRGSVQIPMRNGSIAMLDSGEVLYHFGYQRPLTLDTGKSDAPRTCVEADQIVYGTLTGADIMLLQLTETYDDIERRTGVKPYVVSQDTSFPAGLALRIPSSLWQNDRECQIEATVDKLKESRWLWGPVLRLRLDEHACNAPHGVSGAPAIRTHTSEVIGVLGTGADATGVPCELNNPCEIKPDGTEVTAAKDQNYVHFVHQFYSCLDAARNIDLDATGCLLPKPRR